LPGRRTGRNVVVGATVLALAAGWFALARPSRQPTLPPGPSTPRQSSPPAEQSFTPLFTIAYVRVNGQPGDLAAFRGSDGAICLHLATEGTISCDLSTRPGQAIHLAYANWLYMESAPPNLGVIVVGAIDRRVSTVRVALGEGMWGNATILTPPPALEFNLRLFYIEQRTTIQNLNRVLPVIARDGRGREIGRKYYLTCSVLAGDWCFRFFNRAANEE
jgi:hypothetical protein